MNKVKEFISDFKANHKDSLEDVFSYGYCYWFAFILESRFEGKIYYNPVVNHFATRIRNHLYDITGEISRQGFEDWEEFQKRDYLHTQRIIRDCILKEIYTKE